MKWLRQSKNPIELEDTPEMEKFASSQGWVKEEKKQTKPKSKKAE